MCAHTHTYTPFAHFGFCKKREREGEGGKEGERKKEKEREGASERAGIRQLLTYNLLLSLTRTS